MDDTTVGAATAIWHDDISQAERWFHLLHQQYKALVDRDDYQSLNDSGEDWTEFEQSLRGGEFADDKVDKFVRYIDESGRDRMDVVAELAADESTSYQIYTNWLAYVAQWDGAWDGTDESWRAFAERFTYYADEQGLKPAAELFVSEAESSSSKAALFGERRLSLAEVHDEEVHDEQAQDEEAQDEEAQDEEAQDEATHEPAYAQADEHAWPGFVKQWYGAWDQSVESWDHFVVRFLADADAKGLRAPADRFLSQPDDTKVLVKPAPAVHEAGPEAESAAESDAGTQEYEAMVEALLNDPAKLDELVADGALMLEEDDEVEEPEEAVVPA
jgi:hypothetical protein